MKTSQPLDLRTGLHLLLYAFSGSLTANLAASGPSSPNGTGGLHPGYMSLPLGISPGALFLLSGLLLALGQTVASLRRNAPSEDAAAAPDATLLPSPTVRTAFAGLIYVLGGAVAGWEHSHLLPALGWTAASLLVSAAALSGNTLAYVGSLRWSAMGLGFLFGLDCQFPGNFYIPWNSWSRLGLQMALLMLATAPVMISLFFREAFRPSQQWPFSVAILGSFGWVCPSGFIVEELLPRSPWYLEIPLWTQLCGSLAMASVSLLWVWSGPGRPSPMAGLREQFSWISSVLIMVDASYLMAIHGLFFGRLLLPLWGPLLVAQILIRRQFLENNNPSETDPPRPSPG